MHKLLKKADRSGGGLFRKLFKPASIRRAGTKLSENKHYLHLRNSLTAFKEAAQETDAPLPTDSRQLEKMKKELQSSLTSAQNFLKALQTRNFVHKQLYRKVQPLVPQFRVLLSLVEEMRAYQQHAQTEMLSFAEKGRDMEIHRQKQRILQGLRRMQDWIRNVKPETRALQVFLADLQDHIAEECRCIERIAQDAVGSGLRTKMNWKDAIAVVRSGLGLHSDMRTEGDFLCVSEENIHIDMGEDASWFAFGVAKDRGLVCRGRDGAFVGFFTPQDDAGTASRLRGARVYGRALGLEERSEANRYVVIDGRPGVLAESPPGKPGIYYEKRVMDPARHPSRVIRNNALLINNDHGLAGDPFYREALGKEGVYFENGLWMQRVQVALRIPKNIHAQGAEGAQARRLLSDSIDLHWLNALLGQAQSGWRDFMIDLSAECGGRLIRVNDVSCLSDGSPELKKRDLPILTNAKFSNRFTKLLWEEIHEKIAPWLTQAESDAAHIRFMQLKEHLNALKAEGYVGEDWRAWKSPSLWKNVDASAALRNSRNVNPWQEICRLQAYQAAYQGSAPEYEAALLDKSATDTPESLRKLPTTPQHKTPTREESAQFRKRLRAIV